MRAVAIVVTLLCVNAAWAQVLSETNKDLGHGFHYVVRSMETPPGVFEGIGHFGFLLYKDIELGQSSTYSIAPSGHYALVQDGHGDIILFTTSNRQQRVVHKFAHSRAEQFGWNEQQNEAKVLFQDKSLAKVVLNAPYQALERP